MVGKQAGIFKLKCHSNNSQVALLLKQHVLPQFNQIDTAPKLPGQPYSLAIGVLGWRKRLGTME
jgi:hypothetical protein